MILDRLLSEAGKQHVPDGLFRREGIILGKITETSRATHRARTGIGFLATGQQPQQR
jgi:hypothetical protein